MDTKKVLAPDFNLSGLDGKNHSLVEILKNGHYILLVFLRHLG